VPQTLRGLQKGLTTVDLDILLNCYELHNVDRLTSSLLLHPRKQQAGIKEFFPFWPETTLIPLLCSGSSCRRVARILPV
jgi:hypothetical protein